jgi:peptide deformylase
MNLLIPTEYIAILRRNKRNNINRQFMKKNILPLVIYPDLRLVTASESVKQVDDNIRGLLDKMKDALFEYRGAGIAAVQLGIMKRLVIIDHDGILDKKPNDANGSAAKLGHPLFMVNAEIIEASDEISVLNEGCLSLPVIDVDVERPVKVKVKYLDYNGKEQVIESDHVVLAKCLQHEIDHTNGILIIDYIKSLLKKSMAIKKLQKYKKSHTDCECHNNTL